jgi:hypothetical protein
MTATRIPHSYWLLEGQLLAGEYPGAFDDEEAKRRLAAILDKGIRSFIDLTEPVDPLQPYEDLLMELAGDLGIVVIYRRISIRDMWIPTAQVMSEILGTIEEEMAAGRPVYVHCWGGIGRTGTVAGCWLVEQGYSCDDALERITQLRVRLPDGWMASPQTREQTSFVRGWRRRANTDYTD